MFCLVGDGFVRVFDWIMGGDFIVELFCMGVCGLMVCSRLC